jgi:hypothetical protein
VTVLADIASGNTDTADVLFLIGAILFGLLALVALLRPPTASLEARVIAALLPAGLCLVAIGWLVL